MQDTPDLQHRAQEVLAMNDRGDYTMPAPVLYPHQWLWDSCFTAIGLRHVDVERAKLELVSLLRGQWHNGMLPNIIFRSEARYRADRETWHSWSNPAAPDNVATSGITQPPMLAEAVVKIGAKLDWPERRLWYRTMWQPLVDYHCWLYAERDPHQEGLIVLIHPWEVGLDNTPPWMSELHEHLLPGWIRLLQRSHLIPLISLLRRDTKTVPIDERFNTVEVLAMFDIQRRLRRKAYDSDRILTHSLFAIEDITFNSVLIRANEHLGQITNSLREELPADLVANMKRTLSAFNKLWDPTDKQYFSRDFITHNLLKVPSIGSLMPLYAGCISQERANILVKSLEDDQQYGPAFPLPSVPLNSPWFDPKRYWQGPSWVNTNWLVIEGLKRYGFTDHAAALTESTIEMVDKNGFAEYFNPLTGEAAGGNNFSWTAALTIDLLAQS